MSREVTRETNREIGVHIGGIEPAAVSLASKRIRERMKGAAKFKGNVTDFLAKLRPMHPDPQLPYELRE